jgi:hypothetical protein
MNTLTRGDVESMLGHLLDIDRQLSEIMAEDPALNRCPGHNAHCVRMATIATRSVRDRLHDASFSDVVIEPISEVVDAT